MSAPDSPDNSTFDKPRHVKYWLRCLKTYLPTAYQSNDSSRMTLAFFTVSALDLLDTLETSTSADERAGYVDWIYRCQHSDGGFRGFTGTDLGPLKNAENVGWDPANLAATYFALAALVVLGDDLSRVKRRLCLQWLKALQLEDGKFGELRQEQGRVAGGRDARFGYCAASVRWMLKRGGEREAISSGEDIDVDALARSVTLLESYEGGLGNLPFQEANAGWTYCGLGTLFLLEKLPSLRQGTIRDKSLKEPLDMEHLVQWLVSRQTSVLQEHGEYEVSEKEVTEGPPVPERDLFHVQGATIPPTEVSCASTPSFDLPSDDLLWAGFSGRCNKAADTCYSFWNGGALAILNMIHLIDFNANRRYLLERTQHLIGGFGKLPGDPPDIMHSYLGLAALACMREPDLKSIDPALCFSVDAREAFKSRAALEE